MSFVAKNDRIYMTNTAGKVIFDTSKPMPHIIQTITARVTVDFPAIEAKYITESTTMGSHPMCGQEVYRCEPEYKCGYEQVCKLTWVPNPNNPAGGSFQNVCNNEWVCKTETVCKWVTEYRDMYSVVQRFDYIAQDWEKTVDLGPIVAGVNADFLLVNAIAARTKQGSLADIGLIPSGLPLGPTFVANNSSIVETSSDIRNGSPWMTRVMSVIVENGRIKVHFKHSNRGLKSVSQWAGSYCIFNTIPPYIGQIPKEPPNGASSYTFDLAIRIGKFTL